jgi:hypothetical protein
MVLSAKIAPMTLLCVVAALEKESGEGEAEWEARGHCDIGDYTNERRCGGARHGTIR